MDVYMNNSDGFGIVNYSHSPDIMKQFISFVTIDNDKVNRNVSHENGLTTIEFYTVGTILTIVFLIGLGANGMVMYVFCNNAKIRTTNNLFIVGLSVNDTGQAVCNIPLVIVSSFSTRWIFGHVVSTYYGFVVTALGITQIALLTVIAVDRYSIIVNYSSRFSSSFKKTTVFIVLCFGSGSLCAVGPVVGWSRYEVEKYAPGCSIPWDDRSTANMSYVISLLIVGWLLPVIIITWCYTKIAITVHKERLKKKTLRLNRNNKERSKEIKVTITVFLMMAMFLVSWSPYAMLSFYILINGTDGIPRALHMIPPIFAKSSIVWNPIIYMLRSQDARKTSISTFKSMFGCLKARPFQGFFNKERKAYSGQLLSNLGCLTPSRDRKLPTTSVSRMRNVPVNLLHIANDVFDRKADESTT